MKRFTMFACLTMALVFALGSFAGEMPKYADGYSSVIHGGNLDMSKAARDTVFLIGPWGSGAIENGQFEDATGAANWNGWTSVDLTQKTEAIWHFDTYNVVSGSYSAWCGEIGYEACSELDTEGGYGPNYNEYLALRMVVGTVSASATVDITATVNHNTEPGYDFSNLGYFKADAEIEYLWTADGEGDLVAVSGSVTYAPGEYVGAGSNEVHIVWHVASDGGWDDGDCSYYGDGALQVDDVTVTVTNDGVVTSDFEDFEDTAGAGLGTLGDWVVEFPVGVGDYAHIRSQLADEDPCANDYTPVVCFIADDIMFELGGNPVDYCQDWCYGPGGYIVHTEGGFAGPSSHIHNAIVSPIIAWPVGDYLGARFVFDVYRHEDLSENSSGTFYTWGIRSGTAEDPIADATYQDRNYVYYGGPDYIRGGENDATDLVVPGRTEVQVQLAVYELGYIWGWDGEDGYPAPFFDNVRLTCYDYTGPGMSSRELDLAQDVFPSSGQIHLGVDFGLNDCRFDMANNISLATDLRNDPGDSVVIDLVPVRTGSVLVTVDPDGTGPVDAPKLDFTILLNAAFGASMRIGVGPFTVNAGLDGELHGEITDDGSVSGTMVGHVYGDFAVANGVPSPDRWMFDLPDEDMLYPGDVLHYFISAWDDVDSDYTTATMPANTAGYGDFSGPFAYNPTFVVRGLPTLTDDTGVQPTILFWNDFGNRGSRDEWHNAFANLGYYEGEQFDTYYTNAPSSAVSNGLGGRAMPGQLDGYNTMVYTCGDLTMATISNLDYENDAGDDVGILDDWLLEGSKYLFMTGDEVLMDLNQSGPTTTAFITAWMGVSFVANDLRPLVGGDTSPVVTPVPGNSVFETTESWIAYGGCFGINTFDAVTVNGGEQLAYFNDGTNGLSAATKFVHANLSTVVSLPYDFRYIRTAASAAKLDDPAPLPARAAMLGEVMQKAGNPPRDAFATGTGMPDLHSWAKNYPNPFNPVTKIEFNMAKAGHVSLKVFSVRGELVRTLINEVRPAGTDHVMWDGTSDQGKRVSSGVYFYEMRAGDTVMVNKMALVK